MTAKTVLSVAAAGFVMTVFVQTFVVTVAHKGEVTHEQGTPRHG